MAVTVLLKEVVDALEMQSDESYAFLDLDSGSITTVSSDLLQLAEESPDEQPDLPDWQVPEWEMAKQIVSTSGFRKLPTNFDIHEWAIMQDFAHSIASGNIRQELLHAIHGAGAFRHFKATVRRHRIESDWFAFRDDALTQIAREWCEKHQIGWR